MNPIKGAIEAGGTKWICALGDEQGAIIDERIIETGQPDETLSAVITALKELSSEHGNFQSLGIGSFGPIVLDPKKPNYGSFVNTPKENWSGYNMILPLKKAFGKDLPIALDTDVNTAVLAEAHLGAGRGYKNICYITVGTGIGGGVMVNGQLIKGRMHPELGHLPVETSSLEIEDFVSACPFHRHCVEGKASGTAMKQRWKTTPENMPDIAWQLEADYLAQLAVTLTASYSPDLIIFGGGVSKHPPLIPLIQEHFIELAGEYWELPAITDYIQVTSFEDRAGLVGALLLAP